MRLPSLFSRLWKTGKGAAEKGDDEMTSEKSVGKEKVGERAKWMATREEGAGNDVVAPRRRRLDRAFINEQVFPCC